MNKRNITEEIADLARLDYYSNFSKLEETVRTFDGEILQGTMTEDDWDAAELFLWKMEAARENGDFDSFKD